MRWTESILLMISLSCILVSFPLTEIGNVKNSLIKNNLKGRVKMIVEETYGVVIKFGEISKSEDKTKLKQILKYDVNGSLIELLTYDLMNKNSIPSPNYKYDSKGNCMVI